MFKHRSMEDCLTMVRVADMKTVGKNLVSLCPMHDEKTPSFTVNEEHQAWHCFGCGIGGDALFMGDEIAIFSGTT